MGEKMKTLRIGVIGMGWMGHAHSRSWLALSQFYPELHLRARLVACADTDAARRADAKARYGFSKVYADWRDLIAAGEIDALSITAPNFLHLQMIEAAAKAGMHIYCEKPAGKNANETRRAALCAKRAGVLSAVGYNYRFAPMVQYCRKLLDGGHFGEVEQLDCRFLSMYGSDPMGRLSWRYDKNYAGAGAGGDMLSHAADMAVFLAGGIAEVSAHRRLFIAKRPLPPGEKDNKGEGETHFAAGKESDPKGAVTNEDYIGALVKFDNGAAGFLESSRVARGPKCEMAFALYGRRGSARWNFEKMNELQLYLPNGKAANDGYASLLAGSAHPQHSRFNPGDGIGAGFEDLKKMEAAKFAADIKNGKQQQSGLQQAASAAEVVAAALRSCQNGTWQKTRQT
ncbi:MAG: Gfo/Idh/MocA family protein [Gammaproteobacteria bacterium]